MVKAVLFDYGGVMSDGGRGIELTDRIAKNLNISSELALELLDVGWTLYANGVVPEEEFWRQFESAYGQPVPLSKRNIWNAWDVMQPKPEMVELVARLKESGIIVGLISNVIPYTMNQIREHGVYDIFDFAILSSEIGVGKPDKQIYTLALEKLPGIPPEAIVFIDDQEVFLEPAAELGLNVIHAVSSKQVIADVTALTQDADTPEGTA